MNDDTAILVAIQKQKKMGILRICAFYIYREKMPETFKCSLLKKDISGYCTQIPGTYEYVFLFMYPCFGILLSTSTSE